MRETDSRRFLEVTYERYHRPEFLQSDPLEIVHRFRDPRDQEVVALLCAILAYGNVKQIRASIEAALACIAKHSPSPYEWVVHLRDTDENPFRGWVHRFNTGKDLFLFFRLVAWSLKTHGSVGMNLHSHWQGGEETFEGPLSLLIEQWKAQAVRLQKGRALTRSFSYFLNSPRDGSSCKRWCMLLRWMGRRDALDLGLWMQPNGLQSRHLVIPLDTHVGSLSQHLGLTERKSLGWKAALEITERLRDIDPADPIRFDFSLCRLGIMDLPERKWLWSNSQKTVKNVD